MKGYILKCTANIQKVLKVHVCWCVCGEMSTHFVWEDYPEEDTKSFYLTQSGWTLYYNKITVFLQNINITSELHENSN